MLTHLVNVFFWTRSCSSNPRRQSGHRPVVQKQSYFASYGYSIPVHFDWRWIVDWSRWFREWYWSHATQWARRVIVLGCSFLSRNQTGGAVPLRWNFTSKWKQENVQQWLPDENNAKSCCLTTAEKKKKEIYCIDLLLPNRRVVHQ